MNNREQIRKSALKQDSIQFADLFDLEEIQHLQDLFSTANGVASIITHPDGRPITNPSNFCRLCSSIIRKTDKGLANCIKSDALIGRKSPSGLVVQQCLSGGLFDAGASIIVGEIHVANWLIGQVRNEDLDEERLLQYADEIGANREEFRSALREVPVMSSAKLTSVARMLSAFTDILSDKAYSNFQLKSMMLEREKDTILLQESEKNYADIFQTVSEGIAHTTFSGRILAVNKAMEHILEINKEDVVGKNVLDLAMVMLSETSLGIFQPIIRNFFRGIESPTFHLEFKGKILEVNITINRETKRLTGLVRDITERRRAEGELEESREKYRGLSEAAFESIFLSEKGKCIEQNLTGEKTFGYTNEEALVRYGTEWIAPEYREMVMQNMLRGYEEPYEAVALKKDGTTFPCMLRGKMMFYKGKDVRVTSLTDITELKRVEKKSRQLSRGIEQSPAAVVITNPQGRIEYVNPKFAEMTQHTLSQVQGTIARILDGEKNPDGFHEEIWQTIRSGKEWRGDYISRRAGGEQYWEAVSISPLQDPDGTISNFIILAEDISDRKAMFEELSAAKEKAEQSDRLKSTFLANMSHEIRTPMNAITGFAGLLIDPETTPDDRALFANIIQSRSDDLMRIINDILELSRIESGNATIEKERIALNDMLHEIETVTTRKVQRLNKLHISITCDIPELPEEFSFFSDPFIIKQVFTNLLDNAIKFTPAGFIRYGYLPPENNRITCFVADSGIGIGPENHGIIFEHFRQAEKQNHHQYGGTGLGLSICKGSIDLLGGEIRVESELGKGSTFYFTLPFDPPAGSVPGPKPASQEQGQRNEGGYYNWKGKKILLVEDEVTNMKLLTILLNHTGAEFLCAVNGKEVRDHYETIDQVDLVLLDVRLPDANGWELAKELKSIRPGLPVIVQTAFAMAGDREKSLAAGCNDHISKPIKKEQLLKMISGYLG
ncbi:MAG: PocR ligand-binding domain-containing protein [Bacteroidota bacterium]